jgi:putative oxidoreductase
MKKLLTFSFLPVSFDAAILIFRVWVSLSLFWKHGIEKFERFSAIANDPKSLDPLHIGIVPTITWATFTDGICSLFIIIGLFTRLSALFMIGTLVAVFLLFHHGSFLGDAMDAHGDHAEVVYLYLGSYLFLFFVGAGKYSIDNKLLKNK